MVNIVDRAGAYGMRAERIEGNNPVAIYEKVKPVADEMRTIQSGPVFFECMTYRWMEHVGPNQDYSTGYRPRAEAESWMQNDPARLMAEKLDSSTRPRIASEVEAEIGQ